MHKLLFQRLLVFCFETWVLIFRPIIMQIPWGANKTIVLLFFNSYKVSQVACKRLIAERCGTKRKVTSI